MVRRQRQCRVHIQLGQVCASLAPRGGEQVQDKAKLTAVGVSWFCLFVFSIFDYSLATEARL